MPGARSETSIRGLGWALAALVAVTLAAGCGGDSDSPPGSPDNPVAATDQQQVAATGSGSGDARDPESGDAAAAEGEPGFEKLVERQSARPRSRFSPCNLVTRSEARAVLRAAIVAPSEAPQGPTCIYKGAGGRPFVTVVVQRRDFGQLERSLRKRQRVAVAGKTGYCGTYGRAALHVALGDGRVLSIAARCDRARRLAALAIPRLRG